MEHEEIMKYGWELRPLSLRTLGPVANQTIRTRASQGGADDGAEC